MLITLFTLELKFSPMNNIFAKAPPKKKTKYLEGGQ